MIHRSSTRQSDVSHQAKRFDHGVPRFSSPGRSLDAADRTLMEERFGHDFSRVKVHTNAKASESVRAVGARAYAIGNDIAFDGGEFAPNSSEGRRLLAHELGHVVEQSYGNVMLQRETKPPPARRNVVLLLGSDKALPAEAKLLSDGGKTITAKSLDELATELGKVDFPIATMYVISHSLSSGDIGIEGDESTVFVMPSELAKRLEGVVRPEYAPELIDFRGCSLGSSPDAMEQIRSALGANAAMGGNCFMVTRADGPVQIGGRSINKLGDLKDGDRTVLEGAIRDYIAAQGKIGGCALNGTVDGYFKAGGRIVFQWFSDSMSEEWDDRTSRCYQSLTPETVDPSKPPEGEDGYGPGIAGKCRLIRVEKRIDQTE